jgi:hypothetical protein
VSDPARTIARNVAVQLAGEYGRELPVEVESALLRIPAGSRLEEEPTQFVDPFEIAGLIVDVAALACGIYAVLRREKPRPEREELIRTVRVRMAEHADLDAATRDHVIEVVVAETIRTTEIE